MNTPSLMGNLMNLALLATSLVLAAYYIVWPRLQPLLYRSAKPATDAVMAKVADDAPAKPEPSLSGLVGFDRMSDADKTNIMRTLKLLPDGHQAALGALMGGIMAGGLAISAGTINGKQVAVICAIPDATGKQPGPMIQATRVPIAILTTSNLFDDIEVEKRDDGTTPAALGLPPLLPRSPFANYPGCDDPDCEACNPAGSEAKADAPKSTPH